MGRELGAVYAAVGASWAISGGGWRLAIPGEDAEVRPLLVFNPPFFVMTCDRGDNTSVPKRGFVDIRAHPLPGVDDGPANGFVDIHAHALSGIDDGPATMIDALALLRAAGNSGTTTLVATPHVRPDFPGVLVTELAARVEALREEAERESIGMRLVIGAEVSLGWAVEASDDELALASYGQRGKDLLIETPRVVVAGLGQLLYRPRSRGFRVTLAHPERSPMFQRDPSQVEDLVSQGILLQVDAAALLGPGRSPIGRLAAKLCRDGLAHVIASDGHRAASWRPVTALADAVEAVCAIVGPARAQWMVCGAPAAIVAGLPLPEPPPVSGGGGGALSGRRYRRRP
jgi:protein-tyrosine phosphatase